MHEKTQVTTNHLCRARLKTCSNIVLECVCPCYRRDTNHVHLRFSVAEDKHMEVQV